MQLLDRLREDLLPLAPDSPVGEAEAGEEACPPVRRTDFAAVGYDLDARLAPEMIRRAVALVGEAGFAMDAITGVDWPEQGQIELVYDFCHFTEHARVVVRTRLPREAPEIPSVADIFAGANWHERETAEFYGVVFSGHPNPIHLLLPDDFEGYPLRKDFKVVEVEL